MALATKQGRDSVIASSIMEEQRHLPASGQSMPSTVSAAVDCLLDEIDRAFLRQLRLTPKKSLRVYHYDWGPVIQRRFRLTGPNHALIEDCKHIYALRMRARYSEFELERLSKVETLMPRNSAFVVILEALWDRLQELEAAQQKGP